MPMRLCNPAFIDQCYPIAFWSGGGSQQYQLTGAYGRMSYVTFNNAETAVRVKQTSVTTLAQHDQTRSLLYYHPYWEPSGVLTHHVGQNLDLFRLETVERTYLAGPVNIVSVHTDIQASFTHSEGRCDIGPADTDLILPNSSNGTKK